MAILCGLNTQSMAQDYQKIQNGIKVHIKDKSVTGGYMKLQFVSPSIVHVQISPTDKIDESPTLMLEQKPLSEVSFKVDESTKEKSLQLKTTDLQVGVDLKTGLLDFLDKNGRPLLKESAGTRHFKPVSISEPGYYDLVQQFDNIQNAALYGLGGNQLGFADMRGRDLEMIQYNTNVFNPYLVSTKNFGILWNNSSITYYGNPEDFAPLSDLTLLDKEGNSGALTAIYISDTLQRKAPLVLKQKAIDYRFAKDTALLPGGFKMGNRSKVVWEGQLMSGSTAQKDFILKYGGYIKVWLNSELVASGWRQAWNPAELAFRLPMQAGKKYALKVEWLPDAGASFASIRQKTALKNKDRQIRFHSEAGKQIDYFVVTGQDIDSLISGYRYLTGKAPIMPKWAYGFWQSKEHYNSQAEILLTAAKFREKQIPIDNIVQDWYYWKKDDWGSQEFDSTRYPDPKAMIKKLHEDYQMQFMISIWPKMYKGSKPFKRFWDSNWLYKQNVLENRSDWMGFVSTFYDAFNPKAGEAFWDLVKTNIHSKGVDAWWLDATEPDIVDNITNSRRMELMTPTYAGAPEINFNAYALYQDKTFYEGLKKTDPNKRVFILTRSAFSGAQRYSAATWSGDISATWDEMRKQIATGINFSMAGIPYWTMDIGGFAVENRFQKPDSLTKEDWRALQSRWFQFGCFTPIFRSHGQAPAREIFNISPEGHPAYASMLYYDRLRYRLMPYIYSLGAATYFENYTIMRGLAMDYPNDSLATAQADSYLFGPGLLVAPVYTPGATERRLYLPKQKTEHAQWYSLYDGKAFKSGQWINADAPYNRMPVFVPSGTILPTGPVRQHTGPQPDSLDIYVYGGQDGSFTLYEDEGRNYDYEKGSYRKVSLKYLDKEGKLLISAVEGSYAPKNLKTQTFRIHKISPDRPGGMDLKTEPTQTVHYKGESIQILLQ